MNTIVLETNDSNDGTEESGLHGVKFKTGSTWYDRQVEWAAEGYIVTTGTHEIEGKTCHTAEIEFPEYKPVRLVSMAALNKGLVVAIGENHWEIHVTVRETADQIPSSAKVIFIQTEKPETPFENYDAEAAKAEAIAYLKTDIAECREEAEHGPHKFEREIERYQKTIADLESGERKLTPRAPVLVFGRPVFIQTPIYPAHNGKAAFCLLVLETNWGDSGNINLLLACDENDIPARVWFEASCC